MTATARHHFDRLDGYRGIAALLIVIHHAYLHARTPTGEYIFQDTPLHLLFANLDAAVNWFFVLSSFLLFLPFARAALARDSPVAIGQFLGRRALRVLPVYYAGIVLLWALHYAGTVQQWRDLFAHLSFTHVFDGATFYSIIDPAWSLGVEGVFYGFLAVLGPATYHLCGRLRTARAREAALYALVGGLVLLSVGYKALALAVWRVPLDDTPVYWGPLAKLDAFALGMLLAVAVAAGHREGAGGGGKIWSSRPAAGLW